MLTQASLSRSSLLQIVIGSGVYSKLDYMQNYLLWSFVDDFEAYNFKMRYDMNRDNVRAINLSLKKAF